LLPCQPGLEARHPSTAQHRTTTDGRNAGGDRYQTDGLMTVGVLKPTDGDG